MSSLVRGVSRLISTRRVVSLENVPRHVIKKQTFQRTSSCLQTKFFSTFEADNRHRQCWKCHISHTDILFCPSCKSIQEPVTLNHFEVLRTPPLFSIAMSSIKRYYIELQSHLHPDNFATASEQEQEFSAVHSTAVNDAYKTLSDPIKRGLYLLEINGHPLDSETVDSEEEGLLSEIFMLSFEVEEADEVELLQEILISVKERVKEESDRANEAFCAGDFVLAKRCMVKLKYYVNIETTANDKIFDLTL